MTPAEHYSEAERLLGMAKDPYGAHDRLVAIAHVHATLACAALTYCDVDEPATGDGRDAGPTTGTHR